MARSHDCLCRGAFAAEKGGRKMSIGKVGSPACLIGLVLIILVSTATPADREEADLRALVPKIVAAWSTMDISKVAPYYAADADLAYFDIAPLKYSNWKEYSEGAQKNLFEPNRSISAKINDDLAVHRRGSLAWATFTLAIELVSKEGAGSHLNARWTMVLEKRAKGWVVVHEHVSVPLGGA
jgi:ketosteroid isomerase-like protein